MQVKSLVANYTAALMGGTLGFVGKNFSKEVLANMQLSYSSKKRRDFKLVNPDKITHEAEDGEVIARITDAYRKSKEAQKSADPVYLPASLWENQLNKAYASLRKSQEEAGYFLRNFGSWPEYTGIEHSSLMTELSRSGIARKKLYHMIDNLLNFWELHEKENKSLKSLSYPRHGNQSGVEVDGTFMGIGSVPNDIRASVIINLLSGIKRPVIAEVGGGYGKLFYFLSKRIKNFCYLDFDLPETVSLASYYLMKTFPDRKFLLFGEGELSLNAIQAYDFVMMPSFCIEALPSNSVDLFMNANSFGEMASHTTKKFIQHMERTTTNWFWHMNHEFIRNKFDDGTQSLINSEYKPSEQLFNLLSRYIDVGHSIYQGGFDCESDIYCYIYKRANDKI